MKKFYKSLIITFAIVIVTALVPATAIATGPPPPVTVFANDTYNRGTLYVEDGKGLGFVGGARIINTGDIYLEKGAEFGTCDFDGSNFMPETDYSLFFFNQAGLVRDTKAETISGSIVLPSDLANRAIFDLKTDKGITDWLTIGTGKVYREGSGGNLPGAAPTDALDSTSSGVEYQAGSGKYFWEVAAGTEPTPDFKQEFVDTNSPTTAIFLPTESFAYFPDSGTLYSSIYSIRGYENNTEGYVPAPDLSLILIKEGAGTLTMYGDNSWYNGVFNLGHAGGSNSGNKLIFDESAAIFGGEINLYENTTCEWQGGIKDPYNRPQITLTDSTLNLLPEDTGGERVFSFYGSIRGNEDSKINIKPGLVQVKGDCSGFSGTISVEDGAHFEVRSEPTYKGVMFGGEMNINGSTTIDTDNGLKTALNINSGNAIITNTANQNATNISGLTVGTGALVEVDIPVAEFIETTIHGTLEFGGAIKNASFNALDIHGGELRLSGHQLETVKISSHFAIGSGITSTTSSHVSINATGATINPYADSESYVTIKNGNLALGKVEKSNAIMHITVASDVTSALTLTEPIELAEGSVVKATGIGKDIDGTVNITGGKIYALDAGISATSPKFFSNIVLGHGAGSNAGYYDAAGTRTPFELDASNLKSEKSGSGNLTSLSVDVSGLQDLTMSKGAVLFQYSDDDGKNWKDIGSAIVTTATANAPVGSAVLSVDSSSSALGHSLRAMYIPNPAVDNYVTGAIATRDSGIAHAPTPAGATPGTGDSLNPGLLIALCLIMMSCIVSMTVYRRRIAQKR